MCALFTDNVPTTSSLPGREDMKGGGREDIKITSGCACHESAEACRWLANKCLRFEFHLPIFASPPYKHPTALEMMSWQASVRHGGGLATAVLEDSRTITLSSQTLVRPYFFILLADVKPATPLCSFRNNHITSTNVLPAPCSFQSFRHDFGDMLRCDVRKKYS